MNRIEQLSRPRTTLLLFASGAFALVSQTVLLRQFIVAVGGNEAAIGLYFAMWFAGIGIGAAVAGRRRGPARVSLLRVAFAVGAVLPPLLLVVMKLVPVWSGGDATQVAGWGATSVTAALASPAGFWVGWTFPLIAATRAADRSVIGNMFVAEAGGSAAAGLLFSFLLALWTPPFGAALAASAILIGGASALFSKRLVYVAAGAAAIGLFLLTFSSPVQRIEQSIESLRFAALETGSSFDRSVQTRYQNVTFARSGDQVQIYGNGVYLDSFPDVFVYRQQAALLLSQHPNPRRVLLLGGGLNGLAAELLAASVVESVEIVALDEEYGREMIARLPPEQQRLLRHPRLTITYQDPRRYLRAAGPAVDLAVVIAPDPSTALIGRLFTVEFFREVRARLADGGVFMTSVTGSENYLGDEIGGYVGAIKASLDRAFAGVLVLPGEQTWFVAKTAAAPNEDPARMRENYAAAFRGAPPLPVEVVDQFVVPERIDSFAAQLKAVRAEPNTQMRPVAFLAFLRVWDRYAGGGLGGVLSLLSRANTNFWMKFWTAVAMLLIAASLMGKSEKLDRRCGMISLTTTGFAAMGLVIVITLAYQSFIGNMYQMIALLIGLYMAGLALGGYTATRLVERGAAPLRLLMLGDFLFAAVAFVLAISLPSAGSWSVTPAAVFLLSIVCAGGFAAGTAFPLTAELLAAAGEGVGVRAGRVEMADHLAALVGALVVGLWLLPTAGLVGASVGLAILKGAAGTAAGVGSKRRPAK